MAKKYENSDLSASHLREEQHSTVFARATIWALTLGLLGFVGWAAITPVYEVVSGSGQIRPTGRVQLAEHLEGGIVAQIHVEEGDLVDRGALLISLDRSTVASELEKAHAEEASLKEQYARAKALFSGDPLGGSVIDEAYAAEGVFREAQIGVLRADREILEAELDALIMREEKLNEEIAILTERANRLDILGAQNLIRDTQLEDARRDLVRQQSELARLQGEKAVRSASIHRSLGRETELLASFRRETALALEDLSGRLVAARQTIAQLTDRLDRSFVRAPIAGVVQALSVSNAGQVLQAGAAVAEIVPAESGLFAEIEVSADRISGVAPGRPASLKILTYDFTRFGAIDALVERVSPTSIAREDGSAVFRVRLTFDQASLGTARRVGTGMTVTADIKTDQRTVLAYLLKPLRVIADRALSES